MADYNNNNSINMAMRSPVARAASSPTKQLQPAAAHRRMVQPDDTLEYCVKQNETLESIAAQFNTTPSELCRLNRLAVRMIFPGQLLFVPDSAALVCSANSSGSSSSLLRLPSATNSPRKSIDFGSTLSPTSLLRHQRRGSDITLTSSAQKYVLGNDEHSFGSGTTGSADSLTLRAQQQNSSAMSSPHHDEKNAAEIGGSASTALPKQYASGEDTLKKSPTGRSRHVVKLSSKANSEEEDEILAGVNNVGRYSKSKRPAAEQQNRTSQQQQQISADEMRRLDEECLAKFLKMNAKYIISSHQTHGGQRSRNTSRPSSRPTSPPPPAPPLDIVPSSASMLPTLSHKSETDNSHAVIVATDFEIIDHHPAPPKPSVVSSTSSGVGEPTTSSKSLFGAVDGVLLITPNAIMFDPDVSDPLCMRHGIDKYGVITPLETIISVAIYKSIATRRSRRKSSKKEIIEKSANSIGNDTASQDRLIHNNASDLNCDSAAENSSSRRHHSARAVQFYNNKQQQADLLVGGGSVGDLEEIPEETENVALATPRDRSEHDFLLLAMQQQQQQEQQPKAGISSDIRTGTVLGTAMSANVECCTDLLRAQSENMSLQAAAQQSDKKRSPSPSSSSAALYHRRTPSDGNASDHATTISSSRKSSGGSSSSSSNAAAALISSKLNSSIFGPLKNAARKTLSTTSSSPDQQQQQQQQQQQHGELHHKHSHSDKTISITTERRKNSSPINKNYADNNNNNAADVAAQSNSAKRTLFQKASSLTVLPITAMSKSVVGTASNFLNEVASSVTPSNYHHNTHLTPGGDDRDTAQQAADVRNASPKPGETFLQWRRRTRTSSKSLGSSAGSGVAAADGCGDDDDETIGDNDTFVVAALSSSTEKHFTSASTSKTRYDSKSPEDFRRSASADPRPAALTLASGEDVPDGVFTAENNNNSTAAFPGRARSISDRSNDLLQASEKAVQQQKKVLPVIESSSSSSGHQNQPQYSFISSLRSSLKSNSPTTMKQSSMRTTKMSLSSKKSSPVKGGAAAPLHREVMMGSVLGAALLPLSDVKKQQIGFMPTITAADCPALFRSISELVPKKQNVDDLSEHGDCVYLLVKLHPHKRHQSSRLQHVSLGPVEGFHQKKLKSEYWFRIARHYSHSVYTFFTHWRPEMMSGGGGNDGAATANDGGSAEQAGFILFDVHYGSQQLKEHSAATADDHAPTDSSEIDHSDSESLTSSSDDDDEHSDSSYSTPASSTPSPAASDHDETLLAAAGGGDAHSFASATTKTTPHRTHTAASGPESGDADRSKKKRRSKDKKPTLLKNHHHHHHQPTSASPSASSTSSHNAATRLKQQKDAAQRYRRVSEQALHQFEIDSEKTTQLMSRKKSSSVDVRLSCEWEVVALDEAMRRATVLDSLDPHAAAAGAHAMSENGENFGANSQISSSQIHEAGGADWLPELIDAESSLLQTESNDLLRKLSNPVVLPARAQGYPWRMVFNTAVHGFSLKSLYRNMQPANELNNTAPFCVLLVCDTNNNTFGAMLSQPLKISDTFYGTGESFVFTFAPKFRHYMWTGENSLFVKGTKEALFVGASDGNFSIWLDGDLYHGRTQRCATFDNDALVPGSGDFVVKAVEAWAIY